MADFNLQTLYNFQPARYMCERCLGLLVVLPKWKESVSAAVCPVCGVEYEPTEEYPRYMVDSYFAGRGLSIEFSDLLQHCMDLAGATLPHHPLEDTKLQMRMLLEALSKAEKFVHFVSFGINEFFHGVLKLIAQRVYVRGILSNANRRDFEQFDGSLKEESPRGHLEVVRYGKDERYEDYTHAKLIVVDGLLAFKGSANLTTDGWRRAARSKEHIEPVTKVNEVIQLHNTLFATIWAERKAPQRKRIKMDSF